MLCLCVGGSSFQYQRRTRTLLLLLVCVGATSTLLYLYNSQHPTIHTLVSETHKQLNNLRNFKETLKTAASKELRVDGKYLRYLGFTGSPRLYPAQRWHNVTLPLIVTVAGSGQGEAGIGFVKSVAASLPSYSVVIFDIGLGKYEKEELASMCNSSSCWIEKFSFDQFPSHVKERKLRAYQPLLLQDILARAGAVLWLDIDYRIVETDISDYVDSASRVGLAAWPLDDTSPIPTTAFTHPKMFEYFSSPRENFYFHKMVSDRALIVYNTALLHRHLMLPWVQCALLPDCVAPVGAQASGCQFDKRPLYRYSGCHAYDTSALNVVLGVLSRYDASRYIQPVRFFREMRTVPLDNSTKPLTPLSAS